MNIGQIDERINELRRERSRIEAAAFESETLPQLRALQGHAFAYRRNSYSCPSKPSDYWDVFRLVLHVVASHGGAWLICQECQIDKDGKPTLTLESRYVGAGHDYMSGWQPCALNEYEENYQRVLAQLASGDSYATHLGEL